jgi:hypothetical protein
LGTSPLSSSRYISEIGTCLSLTPAITNIGAVGLTATRPVAYDRL